MVLTGVFQTVNRFGLLPGAALPAAASVHVQGGDVRAREVEDRGRADRDGLAGARADAVGARKRIGRIVDREVGRTPRVLDPNIIRQPRGGRAGTPHDGAGAGIRSHVDDERVPQKGARARTCEQALPGRGRRGDRRVGARRHGERVAWVLELVLRLATAPRGAVSEHQRRVVGSGGERDRRQGRIDGQRAEQRPVLQPLERGASTALALPLLTRAPGCPMPGSPTRLHADDVHGVSLGGHAEPAPIERLGP